MSAHNHNSVHMKRMLAMQVKMETRFPGNFHTPRLPPGPIRLKSWYHSKFQLIQAIFGPMIQKLCSDKSESGLESVDQI